MPVKQGVTLVRCCGAGGLEERENHIFLGASGSAWCGILLDRRLRLVEGVFRRAIYGGGDGWRSAIWWFWLWGVVSARRRPAKEKVQGVSILRRLKGT
jgi:hypothetical protein